MISSLVLPAEIALTKRVVCSEDIVESDDVVLMTFPITLHCTPFFFAPLPHTPFHLAMDGENLSDLQTRFVLRISGLNDSGSEEECRMRLSVATLGLAGHAVNVRVRATLDHLMVSNISRMINMMTIAENIHVPVGSPMTNLDSRNNPVKCLGSMVFKCDMPKMVTCFMSGIPHVEDRLFVHVACTRVCPHTLNPLEQRIRWPDAAWSTRFSVNGQMLQDPIPSQPIIVDRTYVRRDSNVFTVAFNRSDADENAPTFRVCLWVTAPVPFELYQTVTKIRVYGTALSSRLFVNRFDPLTRQLVETPAKGMSCEHSEVFDLDTFLNFLGHEGYHGKPCPWCGKLVGINSLCVDVGVVHSLALSKSFGPELQFVFRGAHDSVSVPRPEKLVS